MWNKGQSENVHKKEIDHIHLGGPLQGVHGHEEQEQKDQHEQWAELKEATISKGGARAQEGSTHVAMDQPLEMHRRKTD